MATLLVEKMTVTLTIQKYQFIIPSRYVLHMSLCEIQPLRDSNPSLDDVVKIAEAYESTPCTEKAIKGETIETSSEMFQMTSCYKAGKPHSRIKKLKSCPTCGGNHNRNECKLRNAVCHFGKKTAYFHCMPMKRQESSLHCCQLQCQTTYNSYEFTEASASPH